MSSFSSFKILNTLLGSLKELGFVEPTEIQKKAIPALMTGRSIVGVSETGSGKTLAYALPILHKVKSFEIEGNPVKDEGRPRALVIVPTRELGEQVSKMFKPFTHATRVRVRTVLGGTDLDVTKRNIKGSFEILVATPGRLVQLMARSLVNLNDVQILIFDEADQMLDDGFISDAVHIEECCHPDCIKGLFSATVSKTVQELISKLFKGVDVYRSPRSQKLVPTLKTVNKKVIEGNRFPVLEKILSESKARGTLIFANTRAQCDTLEKMLRGKKYSCLAYRGEMDKIERKKNLKSFIKGEVKLLICTELGSRGLDIETVDCVINYHLPKQIENYIHRVGRTARAGRSGVVFNLVTDRDASLIKKIESIR